MKRTNSFLKCGDCLRCSKTIHRIALLGITNLYYTDTRVDTVISAKTTDDITEGSTNLYYTDTRVDTILEPINNIILGSVNRTENGDIILTNNFVDWNEGLVDKIDGYYKKIVSNNEVVDSTEEVEGLITKVGDLRTEANAALALYIAEKVYVAGRWVQAKASASAPSTCWPISRGIAPAPSQS